jgi:hypothetical protein
MSAEEAELFAPLLAAAERILSANLGCQIQVTAVERLSEPERRNLLLRCLTSPNEDLPTSFILKKAEIEALKADDPDSWDTRRFFSDWVGAQFLSTLPGNPLHGPRFYGGDQALGFFILEDMGEHRSLVEPLLEGEAAAAEETLLNYATRLGKLHADTVGKAAAFEQLFQTVSSTLKPFGPKVDELQQQIQKLQALLETLGIRLETDLGPELETIIDTIVNPGPFLAYIHSDPCPDNVFASTGSLRLIDFEFGRFSHALIDAVYSRMIFPTCWCANRLPPAVISRIERRYRLQLSRGCPEAQEDSLFETALVTSCGSWLLNTLSWQLERALDEDREWGISTIRQRVLARLEAFITTSEEFGHLPAFRGISSRLLELLNQRWPETAPLPLYPAFR